MTSIPIILKKIADADLTQTGKVPWTGANGLESITTDLATAIREKGLYLIPLDANGAVDITSLELLGGADAKLVLLEGAGIYSYSNNAAPPGVTTSIPAGGGGIWKLVCYLPKAPYTVALGAGNTTYTVTHNLNTITPAVRVYAMANSSTGLPYTLLNGATGATAPLISITGANTLTVTFPTTTTFNPLIVVQP